MLDLRTHDEVLRALEPDQVIENDDGRSGLPAEFLDENAPGRFYRQGREIYCRGEEPEVAYRLVGDPADD